MTDVLKDHLKEKRVHFVALAFSVIDQKSKFLGPYFVVSFVKCKIENVTCSHRWSKMLLQLYL